MLDNLVTPDLYLRRYFQNLKDDELKNPGRRNGDGFFGCSENHRNMRKIFERGIFNGISFYIKDRMPAPGDFYIGCSEIHAPKLFIVHEVDHTNGLVQSRLPLGEVRIEECFVISFE